MSFYRRKLPHWHPPGKALFVTWRLHETIQNKHYLVRPEIAQIVSDAILYSAGRLRHYELPAWVVMSNHVHVLIDPLIEPSAIFKSLKGITGRRANAVLNRSGNPFWQHESFDHWLRDAAEFRDLKIYVEANPVRAGVVSNPGSYRWSSAFGSSGSGPQAG